MIKKQPYFLFWLILAISCSTAGCSAQQPDGLFANINGRWLVAFNSKDIGLANTVFTFAARDSTFTAYTRKGAAGDILGFWKATLAKTFSDNFKHGSLLRITDGIITRKGDTLVLRAIFRSPAGNYYFNGRIINDSLKARLTNGSRETRGMITGAKTKVTFPLADYPKIVQSAIDTTKAEIFNPAITQSQDWQKFEKRIGHVAPEMQDDVELIFAWYYYAGKLQISHFALVKTEPRKAQQQIEKYSGGNIILTMQTPETALLKINSFDGSAAEMDSVFSIIRQKGYHNLIVDLRNNPGGNIEAGMAFARNVLDTPLTAGVFLTQKWFNSHKNLPDKTQYAAFPYFTAANFDLIIKGIHSQEGLVLKVIPNHNPYKGKLFILTSKVTASTCEPIVYGLKKAGRATVIGEKTAGAMMNGEFFQLPDNFSLIVPTAIYYTADGYKIDQNGVLPGVPVAADSALNYVISHLVSKN